MPGIDYKFLPCTIKEFADMHKVEIAEAGGGVKTEYKKYLLTNAHQHHYNDRNLQEWYNREIEDYKEEV